MNPPPPPPIWEQVKALVDRNREMGQTIKELRARVIELEQQDEAKDRTIARLSVKLEGRPMWDDDHIEPTDPEYDDGTDAVLGWCTCGAKTPQGQHHAHDCPARKNNQ